MIKAFKEFWIDYWKVVQESMKWLKKHWIGYIILCVVVFGICLIPEWVSSRKAQKNLETLFKNASTMKMDDL